MHEAHGQVCQRHTVTRAFLVSLKIAPMRHHPMPFQLPSVASQLRAVIFQLRLAPFNRLLSTSHGCWLQPQAECKRRLEGGGGGFC